MLCSRKTGKLAKKVYNVSNSSEKKFKKSQCCEKTMYCYIACLPNKAVSAAIKKTVNDICSQFELNELAEKRRIPHITLKSPFIIRATKDLEQMLAEFAQRYDQSTFEINGFGSFDDDHIIYVKVQPSPQMIAVTQALLEELRRTCGVKLSKYDSEKIYHITLGKREELQGQGRNILWHLEKTPLRLTGTFESIAIMQKRLTTTNLYQTYRLQSK